MTRTYLLPWPGVPYKLYKAYQLPTDNSQPAGVESVSKVRYEICKNNNGKKFIVAHRPKSTAASLGGGSKAGAEEKKEDGNGKNSEDAKINEEKTVEGKKPEEKEWTAEEDARLKELKAMNTSWKEIAKEIGRPQYQLKARFKEIKDQGGDAGVDEQKEEPAKGGEGDGKKGMGDGEGEEKREGEGKREGKGKGEKEGDGEGEGKGMGKGKRKGDGEGEGEGKRKGGKDADGDAKAKDQVEFDDEKKKNDKARKARKVEKKQEAKMEAKDRLGDKKQKKHSENADGKHSSKARSANSVKSCGEARFTMDEWLHLQEDDMFSFGELQALSDLIMKDQSQTWLRVAAAFFDLTGRRIHPEDIREKFMAMVKMRR